MNINKLAEKEIQNFIFDHEKDDEDKLVLKSKEILGVPSSWIATQIKARKKSAYKLPLFHNTKGIVYPPSLNLEQSSSEATARFKNQVVARWLKTKDKFCDLTGGFGVDSFFMSSLFSYCDYSEPNEELAGIARHNHLLLGATNIRHHVSDAVDLFVDHGKHYDLIFIDPSRRSTAQKKVYRFSDCVPDVIDLQPDLWEHSDHLMIKASPLLDIQQGIKDLQFVSRVIVVSVDNECKELLFLCEKDFSSEPTIECDEDFKFKFSEERAAAVQFSDPRKFIYEASASIMKSGAFKSIAVAYDLFKLQANTHLYTSDDFIENFPGRVFEKIEIVKPGKTLHEKFPEGKANILLRNYPATVEEVKKKTGLSDGGDVYLIGCSGVKEKWMLIARRLR